MDCTPHTKTLRYPAIRDEWLPSAETVDEVTEDLAALREWPQGFWMAGIGASCL